MKYNAKYDRWVSKDGLVYRYDSKQDKLVLCSNSKTRTGYITTATKIGSKCQHRIVWETFKGDIPVGYEIDHINTIRDDNRLANLRLVTHKENLLNPLTRKNKSIAQKGHIPHNKGKTFSEFGEKFKSHYGCTKNENPRLYSRESSWYNTHNKVCRWEVDE